MLDETDDVVEVTMTTSSGRESWPLRPGTAVEVRCRFDNGWASGFVVESVFADGYLLKRRVDDAVLPKHFNDEEIRPAR
jgi:hypothetical protein